MARPKIFGLIIPAILGLIILVMAGGAQAETLPVTLTADSYSVTKDASGFDRITVDGYQGGGAPGEPELPSMVFNVLVPPDVEWTSLALEVVNTETETLPGTYNIRPMAPDSTYRDGMVVQDQVNVDLTNGKNMSIYNADAFFPAECAKLLPYSQMRKWKFARVQFCPIQYNPVTSVVKLIKNISLAIKYQRSGERMSSTILNDKVMDGLAPGMFLNYDQGKSWYETDETDSSQGPDSKLTDESQAVTQYDYVIITTNAIVSGSSKLASFVSHKEAQGHAVGVVTETNFGGLTGQTPNHRAEKIRQWLINNYATRGIQNVLLIGNPTPYETAGSGEDIPMKMCWPLGTVSGDESPTDGFFADLTGNWDLDGDQYYGEWSDFSGSGGVDFSMEVWVGRIPVYAAAYSTLDAILQKIMDYENEKNIAWRKSVLLPMSYSADSYDGAPLAEQMRDDYLTAGSYSSWRQYQQGNSTCSSADSIYSSEEELRGDTIVRNRWAANDYGVVCWWGHGSATSTSIGYDGCWDGTLFSYTQTSSLDDDHPAFTYQCSCTNAYPENSNNLAYSILKQGGIATVSASRVSWFNTGVGYGGFDGSSTNSGIGYEYVKRLVQLLPAAQALYQAKQSVGASGTTRLMNQYDFNLYGDPAVGLNSSAGGGAMPSLMLLLDN